MQTLTLDGEKFLGKFKAERKTQKFWVDLHYSGYEVKEYWYEGTGQIEHKPLQETQSFNLLTPRFRDFFPLPNYDLEQSIINFDQNNPLLPKTQIVEPMYRKIIDLVLGNMFVQTIFSQEDIPIITLKKLDSKKLIEKGYCVGEDRQIHLNLV
jgi:hypothetical protein